MKLKNATIGSVTIIHNSYRHRTEHTSWHVLQHSNGAMICGGFENEAQAREYCTERSYTVKKVNEHYTTEAK